MPPAVIKLQLRDLASTGATVGRLSAWSTAGALFGTFFTGFVLVASASVTVLIIAVGVLLIASGVAQFVADRVAGRSSAGGSAASELMGVGGLAAVSLLGAVMIDSPCETQTAYYCLSVIEDPEVESGRTLLLDDLRHSYVDLDDPTLLEFWYIRRIVDAIEEQAGESSDPIDAVYIGGGAFTVPRYVRATRPGSDQTILEIDGDLVDVVENEIDFDPGDPGSADAVEVVVGDGRLSLQDIGTDSADVVVGDAFGSRAVPFHLATEEFLTDVARVVRTDGIYAANIIDGPRQDFLRAETATIAQVFDHVLLFRGPGITQGRNGNSVVVASQSPLDVESLGERLAMGRGPEHADRRGRRCARRRRTGGLHRRCDVAHRRLRTRRPTDLRIGLNSAVAGEPGLQPLFEQGPHLAGLRLAAGAGLGVDQFVVDRHVEHALPAGDQGQGLDPVLVGRQQFLGHARTAWLE